MGGVFFGRFVWGGGERKLFKCGKMFGVMKKWFVVVGFLVLVVVLVLLFNRFLITGEVVYESGSSIEIVPLSSAELQKAYVALNSSGFLEDMPKKGVVAFRFFSFQNGKRVWHDGFLLGKGGFLSEGEPDVYLSLHSKYISEMDGSNLCEVIQGANKNGDLGLDYSIGKTKLLWKYRGMMKHRGCFG